jgi:hypothetical protein
MALPGKEMTLIFLMVRLRMYAECDFALDYVSNPEAESTAQQTVLEGGVCRRLRLSSVIRGTARAARNPAILKQRWTSAPICGEGCGISQAARARRASNLRAHFPARRCAPNKSGRRAMRSPPLSVGSRLLAAFSPLARNSSSFWAYSSPFDCSLHITLAGKPWIENSQEIELKISIAKIDESGPARDRKCHWCS